MSDRLLPSDGIRNLRDLGGYPTRDGRRLGWRRLLRSGHLADASAQDRRVLMDLGIVEIHDFRRPSERAMHPTSGLNVETHLYELRMGSSTGFIDRFVAGEMAAADTHAMMTEGYKSYVTDHAEKFASMLNSLARARDGSALLHCTAGKDRTGIGVALVLLALGVERGVIMEDYLLTLKTHPAERVLDIMGRFLAHRGVVDWDREAMRPYCTVHEDYLNAAFEAIDAGWGSSDNYLTSALGLSPDERHRLQQRFLE